MLKIASGTHGKDRDRPKTQEYTFEVVWRFVYCDGIYRTSIEASNFFLPLINSKRLANMKNKNITVSAKKLQTRPGSPQIITNITKK